MLLFVAFHPPAQSELCIWVMPRFSVRTIAQTEPEAAGNGEGEQPPQESPRRTLCSIRNNSTVKSTPAAQRCKSKSKKKKKKKGGGEAPNPVSPKSYQSSVQVGTGRERERERCTAAQQHQRMKSAGFLIALTSSLTRTQRLCVPCASLWLLCFLFLPALFFAFLPLVLPPFRFFSASSHWLCTRFFLHSQSRDVRHCSLWLSGCVYPPPSLLRLQKEEWGFLLFFFFIFLGSLCHCMSN